MLSKLVQCERKTQVW